VKRFLLLIVLATLDFETEARASGNEGSVSIDKCWSATVKELRARFAADAVLMGDVQSSRSSSTERLVKGDGTYTTTKGESSKFQFSCVHDARSGETSALKVAPKEVQPVSGDPVQTAVDGCQRAVDKQLRGQNAQHVNFVQARLRTASAEETSIDGGGQYRGAEGVWSNFSYECTFNHLSNKSAARVSVSR